MKKIINYSLAGFFVLYSLSQFSLEMKIISRFLYVVFVISVLFHSLYIKRICINLFDVVFLGGLFLWAFWGMYNGYNQSSMSELIALLSVWISYITVYMAYRYEVLNLFFIKNAIYFMMIVWFFIYIFFAFGFFTGVVPHGVSSYMLENWYINRGMELPEGFSQGFLGLFPRFSTGLNIVPLIIFFMYTVDNKSKTPWWLVISCLIFTLIDYGRIDMCVTMLGIGNFIRFKYLKRLSYTRLWMLLSMVGAVFFMMICSGDTLYEYITFGFVNDRAEYSDAVRLSQYNALMESIQENSVLGIGLGGFNSLCIRSNLVWQYELQMLAFFMQLGIIGFVMVIINFIVNIFCRIRKISSNKYREACIILFLWIIASSMQGGIFEDGKMILPVLLLLVADKKVYEK